MKKAQLGVQILLTSENVLNNILILHNVNGGYFNLYILFWQLSQMSQCRVVRRWVGKAVGRVQTSNPIIGKSFIALADDFGVAVRNPVWSLALHN